MAALEVEEVEERVLQLRSNAQVNNNNKEDLEVEGDMILWVTVGIRWVRYSLGIKKWTSVL